MTISVLGILIGLAVTVAGLVLLMKDRNDAESVKIYGIISAIGGIVFVGALIKLLTVLL